MVVEPFANDELIGQPESGGAEFTTRLDLLCTPCFTIAGVGLCLGAQAARRGFEKS